MNNELNYIEFFNIDMETLHKEVKDIQKSAIQYDEYGNVVSRKCNKCHMTKHISKFYVNKNSNGKLVPNTYCKSCVCILRKKEKVSNPHKPVKNYADYVKEAYPDPLAKYFNRS